MEVDKIDAVAPPSKSFIEFESPATLLVRRFLRNYKPLFASHIDQHFVYWKKSSIKWVHSLQQFKQKRPFRQINKHMKKPLKPIEKRDLDQKVYSRDTIRNISNILRYSTWDSAQQQLEKLTIRWDSYTVNQVLKTHPPLEKAWLFFNWASRLKGFKHDQFTYTTMLDIFGEARRISSMSYVFEQMQEKGIKIDVVTYTSLLHWFSNDGDVDGAVRIWEEMKTRCCDPTVVSFTAYMKVLFDHNRVKEATKVYKEMLQSGCSPNCYTYTVLMEHLAGSETMKEQDEYAANIEDIEERKAKNNLLTKESMKDHHDQCSNAKEVKENDENATELSTLHKKNECKYKEVLEIFNKMQEAGVQPDKATCNILVEKCCKTRETWAMTHILQYMKENRFVLRYPLNPHFSIERANKDEIDDCNAISTDIESVIDGRLVLHFLRRKNFVAVDYLLSYMMDKNTLLDSRIISTVIEVNSAHCRPTGALLAFEYGVKMGLRIERTAYLALIGVFIRTNSYPKVMHIVEEMIRAEISLGTYLGALLIYRLGCVRKPGSSAKIFDLLPDEQKNTATYTALIAAYFSSGNTDKGLKMFTEMKRKGIRAALGTYNVLLSGLEKSGRVHEVECFRREKKNLQGDGRFEDTVPLEEMICNRFFAGDAVS
ncbi:unnamed protein product [Camellia sinensis]